ncbi:hypothetical protein [Streptomyces sp. PKU-MA01144]|uniref:hypothetical protein n=1 Tax=Streptomyces sp. PKU-MA01144 TaxID=2729138 RepID=UPI001BB1F6E0|nr:hypothetical protein [Streptomyces sp. PKU-MA01144]
MSSRRDHGDGRGWPGRKAAAAGVTAMAVAELLSNGVAKQLVEGRRPPMAS